MKKDKNISKNKSLSTFEREMKNPKFKKAFDESYEEFLLAEKNIENNDQFKQSEKI